MVRHQSQTCTQFTTPDTDSDDKSMTVALSGTGRYKASAIPESRSAGAVAAMAPSSPLERGAFVRLVGNSNATIR